MENSPETTTGADRDGSRSERLDFIEFKKRIIRLSESLLAMRPDIQAHPGYTGQRKEEGVEVSLKSDEVSVEIFAADITLDRVADITQKFDQKFSKGFSLPLFTRTGMHSITLIDAREEYAGFRRFFKEGDTSIRFASNELTLASYLAAVTVSTNLDNFNDHFESFVTETVQTLYPPKSKANRTGSAAGGAGGPGTGDSAEAGNGAGKGNEAGKKREPSAWYEKYGYWLEKLGCVVMEPSELTWDDMVGQEAIRERLQQSVFTPLNREALYQKVASRVLPYQISVLPRGVLLYGPPGCGKTWSMKVMASEAGIPVVVFPFQKVLTKWYGESEARLSSLFERAKQAGRMVLFIDELDALARKREDSFETTSRLVSILLTEMDGLSENGDILIVGSANNVEGLDKAVLDRFHVKIEYPAPNQQQIHKAFAYYARHLPDDDVAEISSRMKPGAWNYRRIARFCEEVVRRYVSGLDLSQLEANEPPLPRKEDYLRYLSS